jgi:hypothetical protein
MALCGGFACNDPEAPEPLEQTRAMMREIFNGIRVALPASVDPEQFADRANYATLSASLETLARNAALLEEHSLTKDKQMRYLARSIASDASDAQRTYEDGHYDRSAFVLRQIAENCVVCHTRLPDSEDSLVAAGFVDQGALESLPLEPRATLLIATRQFDEALDSLGALLADPATHPAVLLGPLTDYLVVSIRVKQDFERPAAMLQEFSKRDDLWPSLREDTLEWVRVLPELAERANGRASVADARALIEEGENDLGDGQRGRLHFVVASGILERFIDAHRGEDEQLGEAFYLLGTLEARIGRNYWVTPAPFLLEESIRLAPGEPFALEALTILDRELNAAYEGSDIELLPEEDRERIDELRGLIAAATAD